MSEEGSYLSSQSRVSRQLDRCKGLIERLQKELEAEDDVEYWRAQLGLAKPGPKQEITGEELDEDESRHELVDARDHAQGGDMERAEPEDERIPQEQTEAVDGPQPRDQPEPAKPSLLEFLEQDITTETEGDEKSVFSKHSIASKMSKAFSVSSRKQSLSSKMSKSVTAGQPDECLEEEEEELVQCSPEMQATSLTDNGVKGTDEPDDVGEQGPDRTFMTADEICEENVTKIDDSPTVHQNKGETAPAVNQKKRNIMKSLLKSLKNVGKEMKRANSSELKTAKAKDDVELSEMLTCEDKMETKIDTAYSQVDALAEADVGVSAGLTSNAKKGMIRDNTSSVKGAYDVDFSAGLTFKDKSSAERKSKPNTVINDALVETHGDIPHELGTSESAFPIIANERIGLSVSPTREIAASLRGEEYLLTESDQLGHGGNGFAEVWPASDVESEVKEIIQNEITSGKESKLGEYETTRIQSKSKDNWLDRLLGWPDDDALEVQAKKDTPFESQPSEGEKSEHNISNHVMCNNGQESKFQMGVHETAQLQSTPGDKSFDRLIGWPDDEEFTVPSNNTPTPRESQPCPVSPASVVERDTHYGIENKHSPHDNGDSGGLIASARFETLEESRKMIEAKYAKLESMIRQPSQVLENMYSLTRTWHSDPLNGPPERSTNLSATGDSKNTDIGRDKETVSTRNSTESAHFESETENYDTDADNLEETKEKSAENKQSSELVVPPQDHYKSDLLGLCTKEKTGTSAHVCINWEKTSERILNPPCLDKKVSSSIDATKKDHEQFADVARESTEQDAAEPRKLVENDGHSVQSHFEETISKETKKPAELKNDKANIGPVSSSEKVVKEPNAEEIERAKDEKMKKKEWERKERREKREKKKRENREKRAKKLEKRLAKILRKRTLSKHKGALKLEVNVPENRESAMKVDEGVPENGKSALKVEARVPEYGEAALSLEEKNIPPDHVAETSSEVLSNLSEVANADEHQKPGKVVLAETTVVTERRTSEGESFKKAKSESYNVKAVVKPDESHQMHKKAAVEKRLKVKKPSMAKVLRKATQTEIPTDAEAQRKAEEQMASVKEIEDVDRPEASAKAQSVATNKDTDNDISVQRKAAAMQSIPNIVDNKKAKKKMKQKKKGVKKMLSWSEDVKDNKENNVADKPASTSDDVQAVIWWSNSKDAVEVLYEVDEDDDEKSVESEAQYSMGDDTYESYATNGSDNTSFGSEPKIDFSFSSLKQISSVLVEEVGIIQEEIAEAGREYTIDVKEMVKGLFGGKKKKSKSISSRKKTSKKKTKSRR